MSCPVCFGGEDPVMRESLNAGIGVLLGVTGLVLAAFARFFVGLARRSREAAHLIGGPTSTYRPGTDVPLDGGRFGNWDLRAWELTPGPPQPAGTRAPERSSR